ncbi:RDD family protein [Clostridium sp. CF012]|uniref:RDD family protein n=1 Tax=Clostridium sp. CF012 TaxID=2843319 RepID=UPI001C0DD42C|nr:RDD family protein [Clostridium sp. CF012]MBU3142394.1 RDD family protein [Clostridium sp. CF012]
MLEQKDVNKSVIEESDDINNKFVEKNEELMGVNNLNTKEFKSIKPNFIDTFKANLIDLVIVGGISAVAVFGADALLKLAGYAISQKFQMAFIIFMVVMLFYMSIMESGEKSTTIGKKISGLIITKG